MTDSETKAQGFIGRHRFKLQTLAFVAILVLPFLLYLAAQAGRSDIVGFLLGAMTLVMLVVIVVS